MVESRFRFNEDVHLDKVKEYIAGTYKQHYVGKSGAKEVQVVDLWRSMGTLFTTARDTAIKYLARVGKKDGMNEKDLWKAIHYIVLMMEELESKKTDGVNVTVEPQIYPSLMINCASHTYANNNIDPNLLNKAPVDEIVYKTKQVMDGAPWDIDKVISSIPLYKDDLSNARKIDVMWTEKETLTPAEINRINDVDSVYYETPERPKERLPIGTLRSAPLTEKEKQQMIRDAKEALAVVNELRAKEV